MTRKVRLSLTSLVTVLLILLSSAPQVNAANVSGNGLRISPVRTDITVSPGQSQTVTLTLTNVTNGTAVEQAVVNDFVANADESGNPVLVLSTTALTAGHSLKQFVEPIPDVTLAPNQQVNVPITISVPKGAAGGGYYGVVRFAPAVNTSSPGQNVSLAGSVGSLILLKVPGNIIEKLSIASFDVRQKGTPSSFFTNSSNLTVTTRFQNEGNLQEEPFGKILLKHSGKILATYELNNVQPPGSVLPDSIRRFDMPLTHVNSIGSYTLEGNFGYGSSGQLLSASTTFYIIPLWLIILFIIFFLLLAFCVFVLPRLVRAYNRRVISKARRR